MTLHDIAQYSDHSAGFQYLYDRVLEVAKNLPEGIPFLELGTRAGGTALLFLLAIKDSGINRPLITVDPYGLKLFKTGPDTSYDYGHGEEFQREASLHLSKFCFENKLSCWQYRLLDTDFMKIWESIEIWYQGKLLEKQFGFVYLDAEHDVDTVNMQLDWFKPRMYQNGLIVIDDVVNDYPNAYRQGDSNRNFITI